MPNFSLYGSERGFSEVAKHHSDTEDQGYVSQKVSSPGCLPLISKLATSCLFQPPARNSYFFPTTVLSHPLVSCKSQGSSPDGKTFYRNFASGWDRSIIALLLYLTLLQWPPPSHGAPLSPQSHSSHHASLEETLCHNNYRLRFCHRPHPSLAKSPPIVFLSRRTISARFNEIRSSTLFAIRRRSQDGLVYLSKLRNQRRRNQSCICCSF